MCDSKISLFHRTEICDNCKPSFSEWSQIMNNPSTLLTLPDGELPRLQRCGRVALMKLYSKVYSELVKDRELNEDEIAILDRIQAGFGLSRSDVSYDERVLPYLYVGHIRKTNQLPIPKLELDVPIILKHGEFVHYAAATILRESRVVNLGYQGGSHGISIRIVKGVSYRVGAHRGHVIKEDRLVQTSAGVLAITNQRLFLIPTSGNKPVTVPLNKIHFYRCSENALELYKEGREKGFFFIMTPGSVEIFGICLGTLLKQE